MTKRPAADSAASVPRQQRPLDPREPLVIDTRQLGRRPGAMRRLQRTVPAPADLGTPLAGVPAGSDLVLDLRLESVVEGVLVSGTISADMTGECGRCLEPVSAPLVVDVQELFVYPDEPDVDGSSSDEDLPPLLDEMIDFEPSVRDAVVLALPMSPLCDEDCAGLCPNCGERLADLPADHSHDQLDPRWAALAQLKVPSGPEQES